MKQRTNQIIGSMIECAVCALALVVFGLVMFALWAAADAFWEAIL